MRADRKLSEFFDSRAKAVQAIEQGRVLVNGKPVKKASSPIEENDVIEILPAHEFVSRSGGKLEAAINEWNIDVKDNVVLDIGASTGGFTQCVLEHGACKVYALDVGHLQLSPKLAQDARVVGMEGTNAKEIEKDWFAENIDFLCMDVSFIDSRSILKPVFGQFVPAQMVLLFKPQFECGKSALKKGIVKDARVALAAAEEMRQWLKQYYGRVYLMPSPIKGKEGNQEYLLYGFERKEKND